MELMEGILFLVGPKTLNGVAVVEGIVLGLVPATKLGGKGIVFVESRTHKDFRDGIG
jgi:hypothetical protein